MIASNPIVQFDLIIFLEANSYVNIGPVVTLSQDAQGKGKETILADELSILLCGWRNEFFVGGTVK